MQYVDTRSMQTYTVPMKTDDPNGRVFDSGYYRGKRMLADSYLFTHSYGGQVFSVSLSGYALKQDGTLRADSRRDRVHIDAKDVPQYALDAYRAEMIRRVNETSTWLLAYAEALTNATTKKEHAL